VVFPPKRRRERNSTRTEPFNLFKCPPEIRKAISLPLSSFYLLWNELLQRPFHSVPFPSSIPVPPFKDLGFRRGLWFLRTPSDIYFFVSAISVYRASLTASYPSSHPFPSASHPFFPKSPALFGLKRIVDLTCSSVPSSLPTPQVLARRAPVFITFFKGQCSPAARKVGSTFAP